MDEPGLGSNLRTATRPAISLGNVPPPHLYPHLAQSANFSGLYAHNFGQAEFNYYTAMHMNKIDEYQQLQSLHPLPADISCGESFEEGEKEAEEADEDGKFDGSSGPYQCELCDKSFSVTARLMRHMRCHTGEKPYRCEFCNKTFSVKENLNVHRRIHTKERPYSCHLCGRAFEHSGKLHRHMRTHTGERPHKCEVCGKTFVQSGQLVIHMRAHTGEKPYTCDFCTKAFTCSKQLKVHLRTHTGEKPYGCDICGKAFGYNHVLKMHKMSHLSEKLYKCTLCDEIFSTKKALDSHIKDHTGNVDIHEKVLEESVDGMVEKEQSKTNLDKHFNKFSKQGRIKLGQLAHKPRPNAQNCKNSGSPSSGYCSDDSGRGGSPVIITPPESPDNESSATLPKINSASSRSMSNERNTPRVGSSAVVLTHSKEEIEYSLEKKYTSSISRRLEQPCVTVGQKDRIKVLNSSSSNISPKLALISTRSGDQVLCPLNIVAPIVDDFESSVVAAKESARRAKDEKFAGNVVTVLTSMLGENRMKELGHPEVNLDEIIRNTLILMRTLPCSEPSLTPMDRIKVNLRLLLECCVPDQDLWSTFGWRGKSIEDIVAEFLEQCKQAS